MYSEVDICNEALTLLGQDTITALTDNTANARYCARFYEGERNKLLRRHPWSFALKQAAFPRLVETPLYGFSYAYELPADCLRFVRLSDDHTVYHKVGSTLYSNETSLQGLYIWPITNPIKFDVLFVEVLILALAKKMCIPIISSKERVEQLEGAYQFAIREAKTANAFETQAGALQRNTSANYLRDSRNW